MDGVMSDATSLRILLLLLKLTLSLLLMKLRVQRSLMCLLTAGLFYAQQVFHVLNGSDISQWVNAVLGAEPAIIMAPL